MEQLDIRISVTIQSVIIAFFNNSQNSMLYVCDDKDNRSVKGLMCLIDGILKVI
ncbi:hypothetical protein BSF42_39020 [Flavobacterium sp. ACN6]|nr:hypothetical protein BSF42_39020 [Flavobacterium sp. ACN6]